MMLTQWIAFPVLGLATICCAADGGFSSKPWSVAEETAVVYNRNDPDSESLAVYYAGKRSIPQDRVIGLALSKEEVISREDYDETIHNPLAKHFGTAGWWQQSAGQPATQAKVRVLVLIRGVPLKISRLSDNPHIAPSQEDEASVDSELAVLGVTDPGITGSIPNPYFAKKERFFECDAAGACLLVGRLDAPSADTVRRMIDDAIATEAEGLVGRAVIDLALKDGGYQQGEDWLKGTTALYRQHGIPAYMERTAELISEGWPLPDTALYFGWYGSAAFGPFKTPEFKFLRGAVACHLHSFSATSLRTGVTAWVAPLLERGAAASVGNVWEPYLSYTVHFDQFNARLLAGQTLAEAAWGSTPAFSWMTIVVGDPLYRPFANLSLPEGEMRDFALLRGLAEKHPTPARGAELKRSVVALAEKRKNGHLLELLGLLSAQESDDASAASLMEHARALHESPKNRARALFYQIDILRRSADPKLRALAKGLLQQAMDDPSLQGERALQLLK